MFSFVFLTVCWWIVMIIVFVIVIVVNIIIIIIIIIIIDCWNTGSYELFEAADLAVNSNCLLLLQEKHRWIVLLLLCNTRCERSWKKVQVCVSAFESNI
jgi:uncharacterized protein YqhQ